MWRIKTGLAIIVLAMLVLGVASCGRAPQSGAEGKPVEYPTRDITLIVPFKPGGAFDTSARIAAPFIEKYLPKRVTVVVKNVPGASGKVGLAELMKSPPDGYTLGVFEPFQFAVHRVCGESGIPEMSTFKYLGRLQSVPYMLALSSEGHFKSLADLKGQRVTVATGTEVFVCASVCQALGVKEFVPVIYDGGAEACLAAMRGDVDAVFVTFPTVMKSSGVEQRKLMPVLVTSQERQAKAPEVPCAKDVNLGVPEAILSMQILLAAPADTPAEIVRVLGEAVYKATTDSEYLAQMEKAGLMPAPLAPDQVQGLVSAAVRAAETSKELYVPLRTK